MARTRRVQAPPLKGDLGSFRGGPELVAAPLRSCERGSMTETLDQLDSTECWSYLRGTPVGRIAAVVDNRLAIRPVNIGVDHGTLLVRTGQGSLMSKLPGLDVVFEADGTEVSPVNPGRHVAWSVIIEGTVHPVTMPDDLIATFAVPLSPWHGSPKPVFLKLEPLTVSGRRFQIADESEWATNFDAMHRGATD